MIQWLRLLVSTAEDAGKFYILRGVAKKKKTATNKQVNKQSNIRKLTANHKEQGDLSTCRVRHDLLTQQQQLFSVWEDTRIWDH